jgi:hypothetical protein
MVGHGLARSFPRALVGTPSSYDRLDYLLAALDFLPSEPVHDMIEEGVEDMLVLPIDRHGAQAKREGSKWPVEHTA